MPWTPAAAPAPSVPPPLPCLLTPFLLSSRAPQDEVIAVLRGQVVDEQAARRAADEAAAEARRAGDAAATRAQELAERLAGARAEAECRAGELELELAHAQARNSELEARMTAAGEKLAGLETQLADLERAAGPLGAARQGAVPDTAETCRALSRSATSPGGQATEHASPRGQAAEHASPTAALDARLVPELARTSWSPSRTSQSRTPASEEASSSQRRGGGASFSILPRVLDSQGPAATPGLKPLAPGPARTLVGHDDHAGSDAGWALATPTTTPQQGDTWTEGGSSPQQASSTPDFPLLLERLTPIAKLATKVRAARVRAFAGAGIPCRPAGRREMGVRTTNGTKPWMQYSVRAQALPAFPLVCAAQGGGGGAAEPLDCSREPSCSRRPVLSSSPASSRTGTTCAVQALCAQG